MRGEQKQGVKLESNMLPKKKMRTEDTHLVWADDEIQLLLETTRDLKAKKAYAGVYLLA